MTSCRITIHCRLKFQSTCHIRGMTISRTRRIVAYSFQSTCHIRGMTSRGRYHRPPAPISIHMPHTWHDYAAWADAVRKIFQSTCHIRGMTHDEKHPDDVATISIHMPHTWHDHTSFRPRHSLIFQSTCHIRGMTIRTTPASPAKGFQSTCHIRGMTMVWTMTTAGSAFQSTCHIRGMTLALQGDLHLFVHISIHMPHTWHDVLAHDVAESVGNFNPHATYVA